MNQIIYTTSGILLATFFLVCIVLFFHFAHTDQTTEHTQEDCSFLGQDQRLICFRDEVVRIMEQDGIASAITHLAELSRVHTDVQNECHSIMHSLGEAAYYSYRSEKNFDVTPQITYCTYGFYHGFITEAVIQEGTFDIARSFCAYVNEALLEQGITSEAECYHGFGHAAVDDHISTQFLTGSEVTQNAIRLCDEVTETFMQRRDCASGVYNGIANIFMDSIYTWPEITDANVLRICDEQEQDFKETCYGFFARVLLHKNNGDLALTLFDAIQINDAVLRMGTVSNTSSYYMLSKLEKTVDTEELDVCRGLSSDLHLVCIAGLAVGLVQSAVPAHEFEAAQTLCTRTDITEEERTSCFEAALLHVRPLMPEATFTRVCSETPRTYWGTACVL